jgi:hypothetical protein
MMTLLPQAGFCSATSDADSTELQIAGDVSQGGLLRREILDGNPFSTYIGEIILYLANR